MNRGKKRAPGQYPDAQFLALFCAFWLFNTLAGIRGIIIGHYSLAFADILCVFVSIHCPVGRNSSCRLELILSDFPIPRRLPLEPPSVGQGSKHERVVRIVDEVLVELVVVDDVREPRRGSRVAREVALSIGIADDPSAPEFDVSTSHAEVGCKRCAAQGTVLGHQPIPND